MSTDQKFTLKIEGEVGKHNSLPVDYLVKMASRLQTLIIEIAKYDLPADVPISLENFKLELTDFRPGSAIPTFEFTRQIQQNPFLDVASQRDNVSGVFDSLMSIANKGEYLTLSSKYKEPIKRNHIVNALYSFVDSFENAPVSILNDSGKNKYKVQPFKKEIRDKIVTDIIPLKNKTKPQKSVQLARVEVIEGKANHKVLDLFDKKYSHVEFAPEFIYCGDKTYELKFPLLSSMDIEDGMVKIENQFLGIYAFGQTPDEAEHMFSEEFDHIYTRYNELPEKKLSDDVIAIKSYLNNIVKR